MGWEHLRTGVGKNHWAHLCAGGMKAWCSNVLTRKVIWDREEAETFSSTHKTSGIANTAAVQVSRFRHWDLSHGWDPLWGKQCTQASQAVPLEGLVFTVAFARIYPTLCWHGTAHTHVAKYVSLSNNIGNDPPVPKLEMCPCIAWLSVGRCKPKPWQRP